MPWTAPHLFIVGILVVNGSLLALLSVPAHRRKLPKIYLIVRSWLCMLMVLFLGFYVSGYVPPNQTASPYWWVIDVVLIMIGLRGAFEMTRLWHSQSRIRFIRKLELNNIQNSDTCSAPTVIQVSNGMNLTYYQRLLRWWRRASWLDLGIYIAFSYLILSLIALAHLSISRDEQGVFLFVIFASQFNDIAQYLCGRLVGGRWFTRKLAPKISPNKTIEGALFGSLLSAGLATILGVWLTPFSVWQCFAIAYFLSATGIVGDLFESAFKRQHGVKDTGTMLPGHGGVLDRMDSLLIGVPLFTLGYWLLGSL